MSVLTALSKGVLLTGGVVATGAGLRSLTELPQPSSPSGPVKHWGSLTLSGPGPARPEASAEVPAHVPAAFELGPQRRPPLYDCDEPRAGSRAAASRAAPSGLTSHSGRADRLTPGPEEIAATMRSLRPSVQRCYDTGMVPGRVELVLVISGETGAVVSSTVSDPTSTGQCLQRLGEQVRFAPFAEPRITVRWPFTFR